MNTIADFMPIYKAYKRTMHGKTQTNAGMEWRIYAVDLCFDLSRKLLERIYNIDSYRCFRVYDPKERFVQAIDFEGKVAQHSLCDNALYDAIVRTLITNNFAVQVGKGTHFGIQRLEKDMRHYYFSRKAADEELRRTQGLWYRPAEERDYHKGWILKGDVSKYFYNIPKEEAFEKGAKCLQAYLNTKDYDFARWMLDMVVKSSPYPGLPIGNQSSQILAIFYLSELDHWLKDGLGLLYGRYMDDFYIIHESKEFLVDLRLQVIDRLHSIGLEVNRKTQVLPLQNGLDFIGFHTYLTPTGKVVRKVRHASIVKMKRKIRKFYDSDAEYLKQAYTSWRSHAEYGNSYYLRQKMDKYLENYLEGVIDDVTASIPTDSRKSNKAGVNLRKSHHLDFT